MDKSSANLTACYARSSLRATTLGPLLELLLSDVATDIEVVARELGLRNETLERMRRALDRLNCAQTILDAQRKRLLGSSGDEIWEQVSEAVRMLAENWPKEYPEGAVKWLPVEMSVLRARWCRTLLYKSWGAIAKKGVEKISSAPLTLVLVTPRPVRLSGGYEPRNRN